MFQKLKKKLKDQRGLTLIELLAVIVILGIIAAIAIPSILNLVDNSKADAHIANAEQLVAAARTAVAQNYKGATAGEYTLGELKTAGYIEAIKNPDGGGYNESTTKVEVDQTNTPTTYTITLAPTTGATIYSGELDDMDRDSLTR